MNDYRTLRSLFAVLAPLGLAATGCGSPLVEFSDSVCLRRAAGLAEMSPASETDFIALRESQDFSGSMTPIHVAQWGNPCVNASDKPACSAALNALPIDPPLRSGGFDVQTRYDVALTRGDVVQAISTRAGLLELLGAIDTPNEAALLAFADGHEMPCDIQNVQKTSEGYVLLGTRGNTCGGDVEHYEINVTAAGTITEGASEVVEEGDPNCAIGRRPKALRSSTKKARSLGDFFANAAHLEAASVHAFEQLAGELEAHGAPRRLVRAALRSRADEVRHARMTAQLARRFGGRPVRAVVGPQPVRSLFDVAMDNATEGCVRETFGALVATVQAMRARDPHVRRSLRRIAADETRHAALSWAIDTWARKKLPAHQSRELDEARRRAVETLRREVATEWAEDVIAVAGMPSAEASANMVAALDSTLWLKDRAASL